MTAEQDAQKHTSSKETDRNKAAVEEAKRRGREKDEKKCCTDLVRSCRAGGEQDSVSLSVSSPCLFSPLTLRVCTVCVWCVFV